MMCITINEKIQSILKESQSWDHAELPNLEEGKAQFIGEQCSGQ